MTNGQSKQWYYKITYFFVANQVVFKRLLVVLLILFDIIIWWSNGVKIVNYLTSRKSYNQILNSLTQEIIDWQTYHQKNKPKELKIIWVKKIKIDSKKYDLVAKVYNPNPNWHIGELNYSFLLDNYPLDWQTDFILPQQNKYLFDFSVSYNLTPQDVDLNINQISWQRINKNNQDKIDILDNILVENKKNSQNSNISQVKFDVINNSHFNFWQIGWQVVLYEKDFPVAVNYVTSQNFLSNQKKQISVNWTQNFASPSKIEIIPDLNVFDDSNYFTQVNGYPVNLIKGISH